MHTACASKLPIPERTSGRSDAYVAVPLPPPPLRPEHVPEKPSDGDPVWVDGEWSWDGTRYRWQNGGWVIPLAGATVSPWAVVRRQDGQLFFKPSVWYDAGGAAIAAPAFITQGKVRDVDAGAPRPAPTEPAP